MKRATMVSLICLLGMCCAANSFAKGKPLPPVNSTEAVRAYDWTSDENNYPDLQVKAECFQRDAKHFVWQTTLRSTTENVLEVRGKGKTVEIDSNGTADLGSTEVKQCDKPLDLKLESSRKGEKEHFALEYKDGAVTARVKQARNWGGFAMALATVGTGVMAAQAANQAQFGATAAARDAAAARADQLSAIQDTLMQAQGAGDDSGQADSSDDDSDPQ